MKDKNPIDDFFRRNLEDHTTKPSDGVWEKINANISHQEDQKSGNAGGRYLLRAAVIIVLVGLSSVFYFERHRNDLMNINPIEKMPSAKGNNPSGKSTVKDNKETTGQKSDQQQNADKQDKVVPIMKQSPTPKAIYVSNTKKRPVLKVENPTTVNPDEDTEFREAQTSVNTIAQQEETPPLKVRLKLKQSVPNKELYGKYKSEDSEGGIKEKLYAYATDQFDNLKEGKRLKLPLPEGKPELEINLGKIFNRN